MNQTKKCTKCGEVKNISEFGKDKKHKDGLRYECKECRNKYCRDLNKYHRPTKIIAREGYKYCSKCKSEKLKSEFGKHTRSKDGLRYECKQCRHDSHVSTAKPKAKFGYKFCFGCKKEKTFKCFGKKGDRLRSRCKECESKIMHNKRKENIDYKINGNMAKTIRISIHSDKHGMHWEDLVSYKINDLKKHLENGWTDGMSWDNYGEPNGPNSGWHIDHIKPVSSFIITSYECEDFKKCWALENLQPLWATTRIINGIEYLGNLNKGNKHIKENPNAK